MAEQVPVGNPPPTENRKMVQAIRNGAILPRISAGSQPTIPVGNMIVWRNAGNTYLVYNDPDNGQVAMLFDL